MFQNRCAAQPNQPLETGSFWLVVSRSLGPTQVETIENVACGMAGPIP
jgi:hypothetical protein